MNGSQSKTEELILALKKGLSAFLNPNHPECHVGVCPPYLYLQKAQQLIGQSPYLSLGAQDLSAYSDGAYTGQISGNMLHELGCRYVIVGHSERRHYCAESNTLVADKFFAAKNAGLIPILCLGETLSEREANQTETVIATQLSAVLEREGVTGFENAVIAYEPVWAIGTGKTATPEMAQNVHVFIRKMLAKESQGIANSVQILYGGSVKGSNAKALFSMADIDGGLVGGASLEAQDFLLICEAAKL